MWKNLFKTAEVAVQKGVKNETLINSKVIKEDINLSFDKILEQFEINLSKESEIDKLKSKLDAYKNDNSKIYKKIETLKAVGLIGTPTAKKRLAQLEGDEKRINNKISDIEGNIKEATYMKNLVAEYGLKYPGYKFVPRSVMLDVMKRYDLVMGEAFTYSKEIPDDSLSVISNFKNEIATTKQTYNLTKNRWGRYDFELDRIPKEPENFSDIDNFWLHHENMRMVDPYISTNIATYEMSSFKMVAPESHFSIPIMTKIEQYSSKNNFEEKDIPVFSLNNDRIYEFNKEALEKVNKKNREVLDPIACLEVKCGYIVMCAWDEEAEIPEIKNNLLN